MKKAFSCTFAVGLLFAPFLMPGCASNSENDDSMETGEPVDAAASTSSPTAAPTPAPSDSVALPVDSAPSQPTAPAQPVASGIKSGRRVMYVKVNGAVLRETADPKGKAVGKLDKGDHLLVTLEGDWARTDDGKYISAKVLSDKGIGRGKKDAQWSGGQPAPAATPAAAKPVTGKVDAPKKDKAKPEAAKSDAASAAPAATEPKTESTDAE